MKIEFWIDGDKDNAIEVAQSGVIPETFLKDAEFFREAIAEEIAEYYANYCDGWEVLPKTTSQDLTFIKRLTISIDGEVLGVFAVCVDYDPNYHAHCIED